MLIDITIFMRCIILCVKTLKNDPTLLKKAKKSPAYAQKCNGLFLWPCPICPTKFHGNPISSFYGVMLINKQTYWTERCESIKSNVMAFIIDALTITNVFLPLQNRWWSLHYIHDIRCVSMHLM